MTGGGIYPALAVHQALIGKTEATLWVGSQKGLEQALLAPFNIAYKSIPGGGMHGLSLTKLPRNAIELFKGFQESKQIVREFKPDLVFYTGGFIGVPMAFAARKIPSVVFIPDVEPGLALRVIMRKANRIALSTARTMKYMNDRDKCIVTGYPLREEIRKWDKKSGRDFFGIKASEKVLLVFGGSKGAKSINDALMPLIKELVKQMHIIHVTGAANWDASCAMIENLRLAQEERYHAFPFLHGEMGAALSAADLVVCRAGASTIGEIPHFGVPAILVPYPHAWRYQYQNAEYLVANQGAELLMDSDLEIGLFSKIKQLFQNPERLQEMKSNLHQIAENNGAQNIADLIEQVGAGINGGND